MKVERSKLIRAVAGLGWLGLMAGCANSPSWGAWSRRPTPTQVAVVLARVDAQQQIAQAPEPPPVPTTVLAATGR